MYNIQKMIDSLNKILESLGYDVKVTELVDYNYFLNQHLFKTDDDRYLLVVSHLGVIEWIVLQKDKNQTCRFDASGQYNKNIEVLFNITKSNQVLWLLHTFI